jgi:hypothetical protein
MKSLAPTNAAYRVRKLFDTKNPDFAAANKMKNIVFRDVTLCSL